MTLNKVSKKVVISTSIFLLLFVLLVLFTSNFGEELKIPTGNFNLKNSFCAAINGEKVSSKHIKVQNKDAIVLSDTSLSCFSEDKNRNFSIPHGFSSPCFKCSKDKILMYDKFSPSFKINKGREEIFSMKLSETIISADISNSGSSVFATSSRDSLSQVLVLSSDFKEIFKYSLQDYYASNVCIDDSGKTIAIAGVSSCCGKLKSVVYIFDIESEKAKAKFEYDDTMFLALGFFENKNLVAIGDNLSVVIKACKDQTSFPYNKKPLTCFDVTSKGCVLSVSSKSDFSDCNLILINSKGEFKESAKTNSNINVVSYNDGIVSALSSSKIFICKNNKTLKTIPLENDIKSISLISSKSLYLLGVSSIDLLDF